MIAKASGSGETISAYHVPDDQMAAGSTLGSPKAALIIKATGAVEKFYSIDAGKTVLGTLVLHHWDEQTGIGLIPMPGEFIIHPEHQEHSFSLFNGVAVHEDIFVLSGAPQAKHVDPPSAYYTVELRNDTERDIRVATYASLQLRGETEHDVSSGYDANKRAFFAWNESDPDLVRAFTCSVVPESYEVTLSSNTASASRFPGTLADKTLDNADEPIAIFHLRHHLKPGERTAFYFLLTASTRGRTALSRELTHALPAADALSQTREHFEAVLNRAVVMTPDQTVNRGVLWAKANMLRIQLLAPTGWCFVNDPTRSNNSVGRDTAWFGFGSDYITPEFSRASLLAYVERLEENGKVIEYYDIRTGKTEDYGLNINDNTPLLILALWHHYNTTGDERFLRDVYPAALKAARYILSQRNEQGLVWCTATKTSDWGIIGWRNVINDYRLSGATTEVNSECYAALKTIGHMARALERHDESAEFAHHADELRTAINAHLLDPKTGLYYLHIDLDGKPRTDVTSDLVFPLIFGVADDDTAVGILSRLSVPEFWSDAGIHTVPRNAINYGPTHGYGLLGGVWVGVTFWYAFAAARFNPEFMAYALAISFSHYSSDPRRNNTVPGQFSEWLHGETLANQGMMLSPWFPPRYLWAAIEGAGGLDLSGGTPSVYPRLSPTWKWLGVRNVLYRGHGLSWVVVRADGLRMYVNQQLDESLQYDQYDEDVTQHAHVTGDAAVAIAFRSDQRLALFVGNTADRAILSAIRIDLDVAGSYSVRAFNSLREAWVDEGLRSADELRRGLPVELDGSGFCVMELRQVM
ncbi:MAG: MGH1-like glycoside hydrolase domain-containing protein [Candidatus Tyrphobacter sp.]